MPLNANEIEGFGAAVQAVIDSNEDIARTGPTSNVNFQRVNADFFSIQDEGFAGTTVNHLEETGSNDPDDLMGKVNEIIRAMNEGRRGGLEE